MKGTTTPIKKSREYDVFKTIEGNRAVSKPHIKALKEAIASDARVITYNPILVNEKMQIIDGQHRFEAIKELGLEVYYIKEKGLNLKNVQALNSKTKQWSPMDYAKSFRDLGNKNYQTYINFKGEFKYNHDILMNYLSLDAPMTLATFRNGKLVVEDIKMSHDLCSKLQDFAIYYERYTYRTFAFAFKIMWSHGDYDHERMMEKLGSSRTRIFDSAHTEDYLKQLKSIYNHKLPANKKLGFII